MGKETPRGGRRTAGNCGWLLAFCGLFLCHAAARAETLTLEDCLREALAKNPEIARQRAEVERAQGTRLSLRSRALPQLGINPTAGQQGAQDDQELSVPRTVNGKPVFDAKGRRIVDTVITERKAQTFLLLTGAASQPLFDFGIPATFRRGTLDVEVARHNFANTAVTVLHTVRVQFNAAVLSRETGRVLREITGRLGENERKQREQVEAGLASRTSLLQAQLQGQNLEPTVISTAGSGRTALIGLLRLMGRELGPRGGDPTAHLALAGQLDTDTTAEITFDAAEAAALALRRRPDLASLRAGAASLAEESRALRAGRYPLVRLVANGTYLPQDAIRSNQQSIRETDNTRTTELRYGADFTWNVLDLGAVSGPVNNYRGLSEALAARLRGDEEDIPGDLARIRAALANAAARRRALLAARAAAENTLNAVSAAAVQGTGSQYELLQAQTDLLQNRSGLLQAAFEEQTARADFDRVTGGYLRYVFPDSPPDGKAAAPRSR